MGYPKSFPRSMVFLQPNEGGIGFSSLYTEQGTANVLFILRHLRQKSTIGKFLTITFRWFQQIAGTEFLLLEQPYPQLPHVSSKWLSSLREFLHSVHGRIHIEGESSAKPQRIHDVCIMDLAIDFSAQSKTLLHINRVRLYLQVTRLSDISNIEGTHLAHPASAHLNAGDFPSRTSELWPVQTRPGKTSWQKWAQLLRHITTDGHHLRTSLGAWHPNDKTRIWPTLFDCEEQHVYVAHNEGWTTFPHTICDSRGIQPGLAHPNPANSLPQYTVPLALSRRRQYEYTMPVFHLPASLPTSSPDWKQFCLSLPVWESDLLRFQQDILTSEGIIAVLHATNSKIYIVSDGGCKNQCGSFGWVLASEAEILWRGWGTARGHPMSSYRAEAYGRLAAIRFLNRYMEFLNMSLPPDLDLETACDNDSLLKNESYWKQQTVPNPFLHLKSDSDAVDSINKSYQELDHPTTHTHVYGHQDDHADPSTLPWLAQLNIEADRLATFALQRSYMESHDQSYPLSSCTLFVDNKRITSKYSHQLRTAAGHSEGKTYLQEKLAISHTDYTAINWTSYRRARAQLPTRHQAFVTKYLCDWIPTNHRKSRENAAVSPCCPHCLAAMEDFPHILRCPEQSIWREHFLHQLEIILQEDTAPPILSNLIWTSIKSWLSSSTASPSVTLWMKGCIPSEWGRLVTDHLQLQGKYNIKNNGDRWSKTLCSLIFNETYAAWRTRSQRVTDAAQTAHDRQERQRMHAEITTLYALKPECMLKYPFHVALTRRLLLNNDHLSAWLSNHKANILRGHIKWKERTKTTQYDIRTFFLPLRR